MKYVIILEDDPRYKDEIRESLLAIDKNLHCLFFETLLEIQKYILDLSKDQAVIFFKDDEPKLPLLIIKNEILGSTNVKLLGKIKTLFTSKGLCTPEDPTAIIVTTFDDHQFNANQVESRLINNIIYKPFDKLILKQHLTFALSGRHPPSEYSIYTLKISAVVEMLKDVQMKAIGDIGFVTESYRELPIGSVAKYYNELFTSDSSKSLFGVVRACVPIPGSEVPRFLCYMSYYGAQSKQISSLRKYLHAKPDSKNIEIKIDNFLTKGSDEALSLIPKIVIIGSAFINYAQFKLISDEYFLNSQIRVYKDPAAFLKDMIVQGVTSDGLNKLMAQWEKHKKTVSAPSETVQIAEPKGATGSAPSSVQILMISSQFTSEETIDFWNELREFMRERNKKSETHKPLHECQSVVVSDRSLTNTQELLCSQISTDLYYEPLEKGYTAKKLNLLMPALQLKQSAAIKLIDLEALMKVAQPIKFIEVSEAGMTMEYPRQISVGGLREFVLWLPQENENPYFLAACNYAEPKKGEADVFLNHFVFFGLTDHYLKHLRMWIRYNYIKSKNPD